MSAERERETRRRSRAGKEEDTKDSSERKGDPVGARLVAETEARLAAANARVAFLESALVRNGASAKDGTPLGIPTGTPAGTPLNSAARANTSSESLEDLRARLRSMTRRADAAEAAAAEAEAAADAASHAAADADAACAGIRDAANARARVAEARAADAEERAAAPADDRRFPKTPPPGSVEPRGARQGANRSRTVSRGGGGGKVRRRRGRRFARAAGDVDGAIAKAEAAMDASRDAARVWSERVKRLGGTRRRRSGNARGSCWTRAGSRVGLGRSWRTPAQEMAGTDDDGDGGEGEDERGCVRVRGVFVT